MMSDWWSLGILLYELATGEPPFTSTNIEKVADDIKFEEIPIKSYFSDVFKSIIIGLTHKQPNKRLGSVTRGGVALIKSHRFFKDVDWEDAYHRRLQPPLVPAPKT